MSPLTIQVPIVGLADATEEPKLANDMTALSAWANGNIADTDLRSANNAVRRLVLQASAIVDERIKAGDSIFTTDGYVVSSGVASYGVPAMWVGDGGVSGQPTDFAVPNKTSVARIRVALVASAAAAGTTLAFGLYQLTGFGSVDHAVSYTFASAYPGSGTAQVSAPAAGVTVLESGEFSLPVSPAAFALGVNLSAQLPPCSIAVTCQLFAYNV